MLESDRLCGVFRLAITCWIALFTVGCSGTIARSEIKQVTTPVSTISGLVQGNDGPCSYENLALLPRYPERVYLTSAKVEVLLNGKPSPAAHKFLRSASLRFLMPDRHRELIQSSGPFEGTLFAFSAAVLQVELPAGFGLPLKSNEQLTLVTQWANDDVYLKESKLQLRGTFGFARNSNLQSVRCCPLVSLGLLNGTSPYADQAEPKPDLFGPGCPKTKVIPNAPTWTDRFGQVFQGQYESPPGQSQNFTLVTHQLQTPAEIVYWTPLASPEVTAIDLVRPGQSEPLISCPISAPKEVKPLSIEPGSHLRLETHVKVSGNLPQPTFASLMLYRRDREVQLAK